MNKFKVFNKLFVIMMAVCMMVGLCPPVGVKAVTPTAHTFATFTTTTITSNGGASYTKSLDVSSLAADEFLFFTVVADYKNGGGAASTFLKLNFTDGGSTIYLSNNGVLQGASLLDVDSTLYWTGILERKYIGGGNLTVQFIDADTSGTYTSHLENVVITIYPGPTQFTTFDSFSTGTITSGTGIGFTKTLDFSHLPYGYLFYTVSADWSPVSGSDAYSQSMKLTFYDGSTIYLSQNSARQGAANNNTPTSLYWAGIFQREYTGGGTLTLKFIDNDTGGYTSQLNNVVVSIYPSPTPPKTFTSFSTDVITDGGSYTKSLDVSGLASDSFLFFTAVADFKGDSNPPQSNNVNLSFTNGSDIVYHQINSAGDGASTSGADTTLRWVGVFQRKYTGGGSLSAIFSVPEYPSETATCHLENVVITIFRAAGTGATAVHLTGLNASNANSPFMQVWQLLVNVFR